MSVVSLRLPPYVDSKLAREARLANKGRSEIAREAIVAYVDRLERERLLAGMLAAARSLAADPAARAETLEVAEGFLPLRNEAGDRPGAKAASAPRKTMSRPKRGSR